MQQIPLHSLFKKVRWPVSPNCSCLSRIKSLSYSEKEIVYDVLLLGLTEEYKRNFVKFSEQLIA